MGELLRFPVERTRPSPAELEGRWWEFPVDHLYEDHAIDSMAYARTWDGMTRESLEDLKRLVTPPALITAAELKRVVRSVMRRLRRP